MIMFSLEHVLSSKNTKSVTKRKYTTTAAAEAAAAEAAATTARQNRIF